jgi:hypothetical protein
VGKASPPEVVPPGGARPTSPAPLAPVKPPAPMTTIMPAAAEPGGGPAGLVAANGRPGVDTGEHPAAASTPQSAEGRGFGGAARIRVARSELRRQLREQKRVRAIALAMVVLVVLGAPMLYFGVVFATRDPVLNSLDRLDVPSWAAQSPEDRIISGSRWCFIDCRFRQRTLISERDPTATTAVYLAALLDAGWTRWEVEGCPQVDVDGEYSCWTRDEYTLDLWVHPPDCAYDPLNLRPDIAGQPGATEPPPSDAPPSDAPPSDPPADDCTGSVVEIKMQNRVADERGLPGPGGELPQPPGTSPTPASPPPATVTAPPEE